MLCMFFFLSQKMNLSDQLPNPQNDSTAKKGIKNVQQFISWLCLPRSTCQTLACWMCLLKNILYKSNHNSLLWHDIGWVPIVNEQESMYVPAVYAIIMHGWDMVVAKDAKTFARPYIFLAHMNTNMHLLSSIKLPSSLYPILAEHCHLLYKCELFLEQQIWLKFDHHHHKQTKILKLIMGKIWHNCMLKKNT